VLTVLSYREPLIFLAVVVSGLAWVAYFYVCPPTLELGSLQLSNANVRLLLTICMANVLFANERRSLTLIQVPSFS